MVLVKLGPEVWLPARMSLRPKEWGVLFNGAGSLHNWVGTHFERRRDALKAIERSLRYWAQHTNAPLAERDRYRIVRLIAEDET
jgi:hypothetical protein